MTPGMVAALLPVALPKLRAADLVELSQAVGADIRAQRLITADDRERIAELFTLLAWELRRDRVPVNSVAAVKHNGERQGVRV